VLCAVSDALREGLEPGDLAVRRGGDEFLVLVEGSSERDLDALRLNLAQAIARARVASCPEVTPSGTVAYICTRQGEELGSVMERADEALHLAKIAARARRADAGIALSGSPELLQADGAGEHGFVEAPVPANARSALPLRERSGLRPLHRLGVTLVNANPDWIFAALLLLLGPILIAPIAIAGLVRPFTPLAGAVASTGSLILALACVWAGIARLSRSWLHIPWLAAYGLLAVQIGLAGHAGAALLDLLPAIVMYGFLVLNVRSAAVYMLLGDALYGGFAIGGGFAQGVARTIITTVVVAVVGGLIAKLRLLTVRTARKNRQLSELDALTGVANVRALRDRVSRVIERADSTGLHPALVAIDLDKFKQVNDLYSHSTGDRVLVAVARAVSDHVRIEELVVRRGGDEFVVVLRDADPDYADIVAQRITAAISRSRARICPDLPPTASVA
jgi:diguanylate cyclase (GGDEF)-like protein